MAATNPFSSQSTALGETPTRAASVTPDDNNDLATVARRLYIGGAGDVTIVTPSGNTVTFKAVPVGTTLSILTARVMATGTTATLILALW